VNNYDSEPAVGLDSQCLTYLVDAMNGIEEPTGLLADEHKSLIRIFFYTSETFYATETVLEEIAKIKQADRNALHDIFVAALILETTVTDPTGVEKRAHYFQKLHPEACDCKILAEAEDLKLHTLLSCDKNFLDRLHSASNRVQLMKPSEYLNSLNIPPGSTPIFTPRLTNPLSNQSWWKL
jgi:hypothetical protein